MLISFPAVFLAFAVVVVFIWPDALQLCLRSFIGVRFVPLCVSVCVLDYILQYSTMLSNQIIADAYSESNKTAISARNQALASTASMLGLTDTQERDRFLRLMAVYDSVAPMIVSDNANVYVPTHS